MGFINFFGSLADVKSRVSGILYFVTKVSQFARLQEKKRNRTRNTFYPEPTIKINCLSRFLASFTINKEICLLCLRRLFFYRI